MQSVTQQNFGLLIAYLIPGCTSLWGVSFFVPQVQTWAGVNSQTAPTISGFLYITVAAVGLGMFCNTVRKFTLEWLLHHAGVQKYEWDYQRLQKNLTAIEFLVFNQFRYYQFHGNLMLAVGFSYLVYQWQAVGHSWSLTFCMVLLELALLYGAYDALQTYYRRLEDILGRNQS